MIFSLATYTIIHVLISLAGIASGFVMLYALIGGRWVNGWTTFFLVTTVLTSVTGFGFPFVELLPSHFFGAISLVVLTVTLLARYKFALAGSWRSIFIVTATFAQYLNVFVLVFQLFLKVPALKALAPTQAEPPFLIAQSIVLIAFIAIGFLATSRFHGTATARAI
jgi:hypothetical protein